MMLCFNGKREELRMECSRVAMMLCFNGKRDFFPLFFLINTSYLPMYLKSVAYNRDELLIKELSFWV